MSSITASLSTPRVPTQRRGQERFELVLSEARELLAQEGMAGFSIPILADRLGFTRTSIYNFFPTPYSVLNELAKRELDALGRYLLEAVLPRAGLSWETQVQKTVHAAARYYEENPVARMLILGGAQTDESYHAQAVTIDRLGDVSRQMFAAVGIRLPRKPVDVMVLAVDIATACLRHSVLMHGRITSAYRDEAARVMVMYLTPYVRAVTK